MGATPGPAPGLRPAVGHWLGRVGYLEAARIQHALVDKRKKGEIPDTFLFLEHPPVLTLGRGSHAEHVLAPPGLLAARGVEVFETTRGGDVTFHGPGQLVGYGIVDLKDHGRDVALYLRRLEQAIAALLARHGLSGTRDYAYTGVWLGPEKVCAIGVRVDRWVTSHGFALNVNGDLSFFDLIVPCGIRGRGVTSLARATGDPIEVSTVALEAAEALAATFGWDMKMSPAGMAGALLPPPAAGAPGERVLGGVRRVFPESVE